MNEELDYAEMLEIPVETVTVKRKERKKRQPEAELSEQLVDQVNDRMEEAEAADDPAYAESTPIERVEAPRTKKRNWAKILLWGEFAAVCALCATIFLTNIFMTNSAINTFVRGLFQGNAATADTRIYSDFTLSPMVNDTVETEIAVSETGVLSFTAKCSVYAPCDGTVSAVNGNAENGYTVELRHSDSFTTIMSGLSNVYLAEGDAVRANLPLGFTAGETPVRVMFYSGSELLNCCNVGENGLAWS
ncbi:MAG: M23 family metallopeptidase [Clostridiales bacterium]|nr:M23 family metallopeptidase [Clostridiales bacterium]